MTLGKLLFLPGDGIGPEVMAEVRRLIDWFARRRQVGFEITEGLIGEAALLQEGAPISDRTLAAAQASDAILFGAIGGPGLDRLPVQQRRGGGLLRLRQELTLFANLRPVKAREPILAASSIKPEIVRGADLVVVRELTGGVYFGQPRGIETLPDGSQRAVDTQVYTTAEIQRIGRVAFTLARQRRNHVTSVEKSNVMESGRLWRQVMTALHDAEFPDVAYANMLADNCAMQLVRNPRQFDVVVTDNLFGDLLSDCSAMIAGSLGMLPSASLGPADKAGKRKALYEPIHGSAPDIAGKGVANPLAAILSFALMLRLSFDRAPDAELVERAVDMVLADGARTADIMQEGARPVSTREMGNAVLGALDRLVP